MKDIITQVETALKVNLYYLALSVSLTLPDICAALESEDGKTSGLKYANWFDKYVAPKCYGKLTGQQCYKFRCSMLHQGSSQNPQTSYSRIMFYEPRNFGAIFHWGTVNDALLIDVRLFCFDIIDGVNRWLKDVENNPSYNKNLTKMIKRHPEGIFPYAGGSPVIG